MLSNPNYIFGIHSVTPYDRVTRKPISFLRVLGEASLALSPSFEELKGGSMMYPWDAEPTEVNPECTFSAREYPFDMMKLLLAGDETELVSEANGDVYDEENVKGTSVLKATTGIASIAPSAGDGGDLKEGEYLLEAIDADSVKIYALTSVDLMRGNRLDFIDDTMAVVATVDITTGAASPVADLGITLTGGSGTIGMTPGDTARFRIRRPIVTGVKLIVGRAASAFQEFGAIMVAQRKSDGAICWLDVYKCRAAGMPISMKEKAYSEWSLNLKILYDSAKDGLFEFIYTR